METTPNLDLAFEFIEFTGKSIFLTGKAGTGKTTFLRELKRRSPKRMVVLAPTGVAAINAGGVTIHSFFQLPFGPYIAGKSESFQSDDKKFTNKYSREKINIIRSMDLLVIDEISMVRADLLDAVSDVLCRYKDRTKPFGGVQLLMIGDLQQLAPVVKEEEWGLLKNHYESPFFFCSKALKASPYISIELTKVFRQSDENFLRLLNKVRDAKMDEHSFSLLNKQYMPDFSPADEEGYITLTTHNYQAQRINNQKLENLKAKEYVFTAEVKDDFPEYSFPTDQRLVLKAGAQVMFVKNDTSPDKRYYNGKIGRITDIGPDKIHVLCGDEKEVIKVDREEWTNTKYTIDPITHEISESIQGIFRQYPLKTAWAITIHKSQGLTFEKAIIDAASAFAHGQVYVALSRCKTLEGLVLNTPLNSTALIADQTVRGFSENIERNQPNEEQFSSAKREYYIQLLKELFDYKPVWWRLQYVSKVFGEHLWKLYPELVEKMANIKEFCRTEIADVGERFQQQLERMISEDCNYETNDLVKERISKGLSYFKEKMEPVSLLLEETHPEVDNKEVRKTVEDALQKAREVVALKCSLLLAFNDGFSVKEYLAVKAKALLEKPKEKKKPKEKIEISADILHPKLYEALRSWRSEEAKRLSLPAYTILHQNALLGITNTLPTNRKELLIIRGIGKKVIERYGAKLLDIVDEFRMSCI